MRSIANKIIKLTNLKDKLLLCEGRGVIIVPLSHCFILCPLEFVLLSLLFILLLQSLLELFDLRLVRDKVLPAPVLCDDVAVF
jgi:hypothetical protein